MVCTVYREADVLGYWYWVVEALTDIDLEVHADLDLDIVDLDFDLGNKFDFEGCCEPRLCTMVVVSYGNDKLIKG